MSNLRSKRVPLTLLGAYLYPDLADPDPVEFVRFAAERVQPLIC